MTQPIATNESHSIPNTPLRFFWHVSKKYRWFALGASLAVFVAATAGVGLRLLIEQIVNNIEIGATGEVLFFALLYPVAYFSIALVWRISGVVGSFWLLGVPKTSVDTLSAYAMQHSHGYFSDRFAGSLSNKVSNVSRSMEEFVATFLWNFLENTIPLVLTAIIFWRTDALVGVSFVLLIFVSLILNIFLMPRKRKFSLALAEAQSKTTGFVVDVITNIAAVRQYSRKRSEQESVANHTSDVRQKARRSYLYSEYMMLVNSLVFTAFALFMFLTLTEQWVAGEVSSGRLVSFILLVTYTSTTFIFLGRIVSQVAKMYGQAEEGLRELIVPYEIKDAESAKPLQVQNGVVTYQSVGFQFDQLTVFEDFSLEIPAHQRLGLVGKSGAGKTTFVSLLLRQHDVGSGEILIDGQNIASVTQDSLREHIAVVPQEPLLFHRSIRENIAYGKPDATEDEIIEVAKKAQAHDFISALPDGYDTLVGERGVKLSGGQKQRVAIARAMLKDAPILVLDEATSALDSESEVAIQQALETLMEGRTVIAIAHRLSTLRKMDRIIVMDNGKIVEDGTHDLLTQAGGTYERLWNHQAGGFLQDS
jgi:ABC-type multidrug transport system fused ATPase/permease subunit